MALVSGGRSTLNPDAPLFVPAAYRQVEDFSPEWWQLVTTTTWFRDYWLSQHQDAEGFFDDAENDDNDVADLLPDSFDFDAGEDFSCLEAQFDEFVESYETGLDNVSFPLTPTMLENGLEMGAEAPRKNSGLFESWKETDPAAKKLHAK